MNLDELSEIKKSLKKWETAFFIVHHRKPTKNDVDQAPQGIKELYHKYNVSKKNMHADMAIKSHQGEDDQQQLTVLDETYADKLKSTWDNSDTVGSSDASSFMASVWGADLNKHRTQGKTTASTDSRSNNGHADGGSTLDKLGEKLFMRFSSPQSTVFKGKHIKKSPPPEQIISEVTPPDVTAVHQAASSFADSSVEVSNSSEVQTVLPLLSGDGCEKADKEPSKIQGVFCGKTFRLSSGKKGNLLGVDEADIPRKFMKPMLRHTFLSTSNRHSCGYVSDKDFELELGLDDSCRHEQSCLVETSDNCVSVHGQKSKLVDNVNCTDCDVEKSPPHILDSAQKDNRKAEKNLGKIPEEKLQSPDSSSWKEVPDDEAKNGVCSRKQRLSTKRVDQSDRSMSSVIPLEYDFVPSPKSVSLPLHETDAKNTAVQSNTNRANDMECGSCQIRSEKIVDKMKESRVRKVSSAGGKVRQKRKMGDRSSDEEKMDPVTNESMPRKTAKSSRNLSKKPAAASDSVSANFVRLNMKARRFVRKGSRLTGAQWKRKQWKQKMAVRSQSYGDKCFKCGKSGHWVKNCPGGESFEGHQPTATAEAMSVEDPEFPSLREAALMARGIREEGIKETNEDEVLEVEAMTVRGKEDPVVIPSSVTPLAQQATDVERLVEKGLQKFGFGSFRPGQRETIMRILNGHSTLVIMSTASGKSLCYQLPAHLYRCHMKCITLVISPLVSLMEDQISGLPAGIKGACLNSGMTAAQRESVLAEVSGGKVDFLLVSPEAVVEGGGRTHGSFPTADKLPAIPFACIDEVHCLSEWSHNFRPSYLRLCKVLREKYGVSCFLGLTATARKSTAQDVARHIGITDLEAAMIRGSPVPPNLYLSVSKDENRDEALVNLLQGKRFSECNSIIIYCTRRETVERVAILIRTCLQIPGSRAKGKKRRTLSAAALPDTWSVETYHAGMTAAQRRRVQQRFMSGAVQIVAATVAFGMGLDKPDVRGVIHYNMPKSFESYVQEVGRAGRDGQISHCHLFLDPQGRDLGELRRHTFGNTIDRYSIKKLLQKLFAKCRCLEVHRLRCDGKESSGVEAGNATLHGVPEAFGRLCHGHERALPRTQTIQELDIREEGIETLLCYLELHAPHLLSNLSPVYSSCHLQCYGGPQQLQAVAKKCPPVGAAIARQKMGGESFQAASTVTFPVVEVSDSMGWDAGVVKRHLSLLQWTFHGGAARKSGVLVQFSDLSFHVRTCGDLSGDEVDGLLDFLHERVERQERAELTQLAVLADRLDRVAHKNYWMCANEIDLKRSNALKKYLDEYFDDSGEDQRGEIKLAIEEPDPAARGQLTSDIRLFIHTYGGEHALCARAIARVFHGIDSPRFPAAVWGRVRRFWRSHLHVHFHVVLREASRQLLLSRNS